MRSPAPTTRGIGGDVGGRSGTLVRALAVLGALFLVLLVAGLVAFVVMTRPLDDLPTPDPGPSTTAAAEPTAPTDLAEGEAWVPGAEVTAPRVLLGEGQDLRRVTARATETRLASDGSIRVRHLDVDGLVPYSVVENEVGRGIRLAPGEDGLVRVSMPVGVFGRGLTISVLARVQADGERIAVTPVRIVGGGLFGDALSQLPAIRQKIPHLPPGMRVTDVRVEDGGFRIHAVGDDVSLPN